MARSIPLLIAIVATPIVSAFFDAASSSRTSHNNHHRTDETLIRRAIITDGARGGGGRRRSDNDDDDDGGVRIHRIINPRKKRGIPLAFAGGSAADEANDDNNVNDDDDDDVDLTRLISQFGGSSPNDAIRLGGDKVRGVYVNRSVKRGETILEIPLSSCLRDDDPPQWLLDYQKQQQQEEGSEEEETNNSGSSSILSVQIQNWVTRLAACVVEMHHKQKQQQQQQQQKAPSAHHDHAMHTWLRLLPSQTSFRECLPIHWPESLVSGSSELSSVDYRPLELAVDAAHFARAPVMYDLMEAIPSHYHDYGGGNNGHENDGDDDEGGMMMMATRERIVEWALDVVQTRSCRCSSSLESLDDDDNKVDEEEENLRVLVPVFDMINHSPEPNAEFFREGDRMTVKATSDMDANEQVCIHYGKSTVPAWKRLFSYGFCDTGGSSSSSNSNSGDDNDGGFAVYEDDAVEIVLGDRFRFEISPTEIPVELIRYQAQQQMQKNRADDGADDGDDVPADVEFTPEIGRGIVDQLTMVASGLERKRDDVANAAATSEDASMATSLKLVADLHESHRRTVLTCAGGLREYLQEE